MVIIRTARGHQLDLTWSSTGLYVVIIGISCGHQKSSTGLLLPRLFETAIWIDTFEIAPVCELELD